MTPRISPVFPDLLSREASWPFSTINQAASRPFSQSHGKIVGQTLSQSDNTPIIVIKSTVIPGTNLTIKQIIEKESKKKEKTYELAEDAIIVVKLPTGSDIPVPDLPIDAEAESVIHLLQGASDNPALFLAKIESDKVNKEGNRVISLKTDAKQKGHSSSI